MVQSSAHQVCPHAEDSDAGRQAGCYIYCVALACEEVSLGSIGIEGNKVYTVVHNSLCALVHDCPAKPYQSPDNALVSSWVLAHHQVVEAAWKRWRTVLPLTFNTIIRPGDGRSSSENLKAWLETEHNSLREKLDALAGKAEYGVQMFWDTVRIGKKVAEASAEIRRLEEKIRSVPQGAAYMYRQKLEGLLKKEIEARAAEEARELYSRLSRSVDNIRVEKAKQGEQGLMMLINLSCLVSAERLPALEAELSKISNTEGCSIRMVGPLPPYSFC